MPAPADAASLIGSTGGEHNFRYAFGVARQSADGFSVKKQGLASQDPDKDGYQRESFNASLSYDLAAGHQLGLVLLQHGKGADMGAAFGSKNSERQPPLRPACPRPLHRLR